jgi:hypothetical protein
MLVIASYRSTELVSMRGTQPIAAHNPAIALARAVQSWGLLSQAVTIRAPSAPQS